MTKPKKRLKKVSKFLSYILRHNPSTLEIELGKDGWIKISDITRKTDITINEIIEVIKKDKKGRFSISGNKIRANYGHSINIDINYTPEIPPDILFHGTSKNSVEKILEDGIKSMRRNFVHLANKKIIAFQNGSRHGKSVILHIDAQKMSKDGFEIYKASNIIWLTKYVPPEYIKEVE